MIFMSRVLVMKKHLIRLSAAALALALAMMAVLAVQHAHAAAGRLTRPIYSVPAREKVVALTYDDGPSSAFTPRILKILSRYKVKATFFMIGEEMSKHPEIVKAVARAGHVIGNHTYTHPFITRQTPSQLARELDMCDREIRKITGRHATLFRAPRGRAERRTAFGGGPEGLHDDNVVGLRGPSRHTDPGRDGGSGGSAG